MKSLRATTALPSCLSTPTYTRAAAAALLQTRPPLKPFQQQQQQQQQKRTFFPNPFGSSIQTLTASRTLPYDSKTLYAIISDVSAYNKFLPFCRTSTVTKTSSPDAEGKTWPEEAELVIGFNDDISESFHSRVYCVPGRVVESVGGETETSLPQDEISHHNPRPAPREDPTRNATVLTHLRSTWTLRAFPYKPGPVSGDVKPQDASSDIPAREQTQVSLSIEYQFANPLYSTLSAAAAPKVAEKMIGAFESRVKMVLDGPSMGGTSRRAGTSEGVLGAGKQKA